MNNANQNEAEIEERKSERFFGSIGAVATSERTNISPREPDTILSMIVLLLACLGLAVLAHVFV